MNDKMFKFVSMIGAFGWIAIFIISVATLITRLINGDGDFITPIIVLVLIAINFNVSTLLRYKKYEVEQAASLLEKIDYQPPQRFTQNPYLN